MKKFQPNDAATPPRPPDDPLIVMPMAWGFSADVDVYVAAVICCGSNPIGSSSTSDAPDHVPVREFDAHVAAAITTDFAPIFTSSGETVLFVDPSAKVFVAVVVVVLRTVKTAIAQRATVVLSVIAMVPVVPDATDAAHRPIYPLLAPSMGVTPTTCEAVTPAIVTAVAARVVNDPARAATCTTTIRADEAAPIETLGNE